MSLTSAISSSSSVSSSGSSLGSTIKSATANESTVSEKSERYSKRSSIIRTFSGFNGYQCDTSDSEDTILFSCRWSRGIIIYYSNRYTVNTKIRRDAYLPNGILWEILSSCFRSNVTRLARFFVNVFNVSAINCDVGLCERCAYQISVIVFSNRCKGNNKPVGKT